MQKLLETKTEK